jgi:hypothetical protein
MSQSDTSLRCRDACGASVADQDGAERAGWSFLQITNSWRCGACAGALYRANGIVGTSGETADTLPPMSRGALPKETATTIAPPAVKG